MAKEEIPDGCIRASYLLAREQLMEEIRFIILSEEVFSDLDELIERLNDAVFKHFPTTAQDSIQSCWIPKPTNPES
tara:strand:+ start:189 stop:416 length:228 start_codon:yes stop_codon:yes gene_type:complete